MFKMSGLGRMTYTQLMDLRARVDEAIVAARAAEKRALLAKMEALAAKAGLTLSDVVDTNGRASKPKGTKSVVKYRNPKDPSQTWSGRGRQPNWLVGALKKGQKLESFLA